MSDTDARGTDGEGRVYSLMVCRVCGADSHDEVCPECRNGVNFMQERGSSCAMYRMARSNAMTTDTQRGADGATTEGDSDDDGAIVDTPDD
jgi:hypothetical protein